MVPDWLTAFVEKNNLKFPYSSVEELYADFEASAAQKVNPNEHELFLKCYLSYWVADGESAGKRISEIVESRPGLIRPTKERHYSDYKWIKVKRHKFDESKDWKENYEALEKHHLQETTFMIDEIRRLAKEYDELDEVNPYYCKECGACGEAGCCPPSRCMYLEQYKGDYQDLLEDNERLHKEVEALNKQLRMNALDELTRLSQEMGLYDDPKTERRPESGDAGKG